MAARCGCARRKFSGASADEVDPGDVEVKLAGGLSRLRGHGDEGALVVLYADQDTPQASDAALAAFAKDNLGLFDRLLEQTRSLR